MIINHDLYKDILSILHDMINHYNHILELCKSEVHIFRSANFCDLVAVTTRKEKIVLELSIMKEGWQLLLRKLAEQLNMPASDLTLAQLSILAPLPFGDAFRRCRTDLLAVVQAIGQLNAQNMTLLRSSLDVVRTSLGLISRLLEPAHVYGNDGALGTTDPGGRFLHRQV
jgi:hypothetical protein